MTTLRQLFRFDKNSKVEPPTPKNVYTGVPFDYSRTGVPRKTLGDTAIAEPLIRKGIWKENRDIFKNGWTIADKDRSVEVDENLIRLISDFKTKCFIDNKLEDSGRSANIYGDGFIELIFDEPYTPMTISQPISPTIPLADINVLNAEYIDKTEKKGDITYYLYKSPKTIGEKKLIHPSRILHIVKKRLPGTVFGISDIFTGMRILESKLTADKQFGEFIEWAGTGLFDVAYKGANNDDIQEMKKQLQKDGRSHIKMHDENMTWTVINPSIFNPSDFAKYFYINIAALVDMPEYILTGVQPGQLTGSEMGFTDYMENIRSLQNNVFTPALNTILTLFLRGTKYNMDNFNVFWNPSYVDEQSEAAIGKTRADTGSLLYDRGVIDDDEYKAIMTDGLLDVNGNSVFKKTDEKTVDVVKPEAEPVDKLPGFTRFYNEIAEKERIIGERELIEQEKRIKKR